MHIGVCKCDVVYTRKLLCEAYFINLLACVRTCADSQNDKHYVLVKILHTSFNYMCLHCKEHEYFECGVVGYQTLVYTLNHHILPDWTYHEYIDTVTSPRM